MKTTRRDRRYLDRDISWMYFNRRILQEACKDTVPLLERMSFLGIYSNNLDEFFRVRVASLNRIAEWDEKAEAEEVRNAAKTSKAISRLNSTYIKDYETAVDSVYSALSEKGIHLISDTEADSGQLMFIRSYYRDNLDGLIVPIWFSAVKRLDYESDENIYFAVKACRETGSEKKKYDYAYFALPVHGRGRFVRLPDRDGESYIMYIDDIIRCSLSEIFTGCRYSGFEAYAFKFTRDAEMEIDNDHRSGILQKISKGIRSRKRGEPLRFIYDGKMPPDLVKRVLGKLDLDKSDTILKGGRYQNHKDLMQFPDCGRKDLRFRPMPPIVMSSLDIRTSLIDAIREKDRLLHVPYHSFSHFLRLLHEAATDRRVRSIRISLYRLAKDSRVIRSLTAAARNGKKVTVVIELLARFDEESNIVWSQKLQEAGVKVIYGIEGLKVHSKIVFIGMRQGSDIACISTGNFHEGNARSYTDCILMTAARRITEDVDKVFSFIEKPYHPVVFRELLVSPNDMKKKFISLINAEIRNYLAGKPAYIRMKVNHITDPSMVSKLYEAALKGVPVDLVVRGNCSLMTASLPENCHLKINGIIDRYLEHSRIFIFAAGGNEKIFMGSADWMPRNLDNRIEVVTPVYDPSVMAELRTVVDFGLRDTIQGRTVDGSGENRPWECDDPLETGSQEALYEHYRYENEKPL